MNVPGEIAALATAVCWSLTAIFFSFSGRRIGPDIVNRSRLLFAFFLLVITHRLLEGTFFPWGTEAYRWGWLGLSSLLGLVIGDTFLFRAYATVGPRISMLMMSTVPILSVLFGWLLFGEVVSGLEAAGIVLAVGGIAWVVTEGQTDPAFGDKRTYWIGVLFAFAGALGQVANLVTARYALEGGYPPLSATLIRIFVAMVILWTLAAVRGQLRATFTAWHDKQAFRSVLAGATAGPFLGIWFSLIAVQNTRLGIASTLMALPPVLLIPMEYAINRKPVSARSISGTLAAMAGVTLLLWQQG